MSNRTVIFIGLLCYLVIIAFMMSAMSETIVGLDESVKTTSQGIGGTVDFLGMKIGLGDSFLGNIVVSIDALPIWFNTLFIIIPSVLCAVFGILMFIPTLPSG